MAGLGGFRLWSPLSAKGIKSSFDTVKVVGGVGSLIGAGASTVSAGQQALRYALAIGGGAVAGSIIASKTNQTQDLLQKGQATTGGYTIFAYPESQVTLKETTTGQADVSQDASQEQKATTPDYMNLLITGGLILGGVYVLGKVLK